MNKRGNTMSTKNQASERKAKRGTATHDPEERMHKLLLHLRGSVKKFSRDIVHGSQGGKKRKSR
jgi:hypothetical protein